MSGWSLSMRRDAPRSTLRLVSRLTRVSLRAHRDRHR
jgi:hypothetical protein